MQNIPKTLEIGLTPASNQPSSSSQNFGTIVNASNGKTYKVSFFKGGNPLNVKDWEKEAAKVVNLLSTHKILPEIGEKIKTNHTTGTVKRVFTKGGKPDEIITIKPEFIKSIKFDFEIEKKSNLKKKEEEFFEIEESNKFPTEKKKKKTNKSIKFTKKKKKKRKYTVEDSENSYFTIEDSENAYFDKDPKLFENNIKFEDLDEKLIDDDDDVINIFE